MSRVESGLRSLHISPGEASLNVRGFYDALAPWYHLVYPDWEGSGARQG